MATTDAFNERVEEAIKKILLDEYPHIKISTLNGICKTGASSVAHDYFLRSRKECAGVRPLKFFDMPREIRDIMYGYAVTPSDGLAVALNRCPGISGCGDQDIKRSFTHFRRCAKTNVHCQQPAITQASRVLRIEALPLFYLLNNFAVCLSHEARMHVPGNYRRSRSQFSPFKHVPGVELMSNWLLSIGTDNVSYLRKISLHYEKEEEKKAIIDFNLVPKKYIGFTKVAD